MRSSVPVRHALAFGLLILAASLVACGGSASPSHVGSAPSGFVLQPDISDPGCNAGRGVRLTAHLGAIPIVASGTMADGSTLVASSGYPTMRSVELRSVTARCAPNRAFGREGVATIAIPRRPLPGHPPVDGVPPNGLWVDVVARRRGGGAILAGTYGNDWTVGEVTPRGQIDRTFGDGGWTVLPFSGEVSAVLQEPSGRIIIARRQQRRRLLHLELGWPPFPHADDSTRTSGRAAGRTPDGRGLRSRRAGARAKRRHPRNGRLRKQRLLGRQARNADAVWTPGPAVRQAVRPVLARPWLRRLCRHAYIDGGGFTLVGIGEKECDGYNTQPPTGVITRFRADGILRGRTIRFPSRMYGEILAFRRGDDNFVVGTPYADPTQLTVTALRADGSADLRFGSRGSAWIHTPWKGPNANLETMVSINRARPRTIVVVATREGRKELQVIRARF